MRRFVNRDVKNTRIKFRMRIETELPKFFLMDFLCFYYLLIFSSLKLGGAILCYCVTCKVETFVYYYILRKLN